MHHFIGSSMNIYMHTANCKTFLKLKGFIYFSCFIHNKMTIYPHIHIFPSITYTVNNEPRFNHNNDTYPLWLHYKDGQDNRTASLKHRHIYVFGQCYLL